MSELTSRRVYSQAQLYSLLGKQVTRYHRHYRMGDNTSVTTEIAQELLQSMEYTLRFGTSPDPDMALAQGQAVLSEKLENCRRLWQLVSATVPELQSQCHWETLDAIRKYLDRYDHLHFAHRTPEILEYPLLIQPPENLQGIDYMLYYVNCLWIENQILHALPDLRPLHDRLPPDYWVAPQNLCEQPLWNAMGRILAGQSAQKLTISDEDRNAILASCAPGALDTAMNAVCREFSFPDTAASYARGAAAGLRPRLQIAVKRGDLTALFL